ncbi:hypothetical protein T235_16165 [Tannerella sp. oral taxon BU063 isolate Cell 8/11]|jgi:dynamin family protein|uniref:Dynamin N-terminal domain-containing protein n=1 Tax=Tannerella sp. oral taxon BU063 isolate Cell 8/11 TaxID=1411915 RepID=W2CVT2_9BACT|nr:hypothetical protein T235_16165 [Tannerella sp. oral taxon BU063 isolate Cell 8/11]
MNVFEQFSKEKEAQRALIKQAADNGFITDEQRREFEQKLDNDVLTIGVIGQMKAGKSTFLNAFVFERDVLPAATTPMTAALTVITYGPEEKIEVEFYNNEEWDEQRLTAQRESPPDSSEAEKSKVQAAQELVEKSVRIGNRLPELLGTKRTDTLDKLIEYVGADGKFVSITKAVKIYYPKEYLRGVEIVDTPGFNDPIVSREERTKEFLRRADAVLLMLYAGRPFDATDREIVFKHLSQCGIGKVVIGINKYDIPRENGETESEIKAYVKEEIRNACRGSNDESLKEMLKKEEPIPLSAEMALLSYLPMKDISCNDSYKHAFHRYGEAFGLTSQAELREFSHFSDLSNRVQEIVMKEKGEILFNKSRNAIKAAISKVGLDLDQEIVKTKEKVHNLNLSESQCKEKQSDLECLQRRLKKRTNTYLQDLTSELDDLYEERTGNIKEKIDDLHRSVVSKINDLKRYTSKSAMEETINMNFVSRIERRILPDEIRLLKKEKKQRIIKTSDAYVDKVAKMLDRDMEETDYDSLISELKKLCKPEQIEEFHESSAQETESHVTIGDIVIGVLALPARLFGETLKAVDWAVFGNKEIKEDVKDKLSVYVDELNSKIEDQMKQLLNIDWIETRINELMFENFLNPIEADLKQIIENREGREKQRADAAAKLDSLQKQKQEYDAKVAAMAL